MLMTLSFKKMRRKKTIVQQKKQEVLQQLSLICSELEEKATVEVLLHPDLWPKTRVLADGCGESIYMTRNILLQLVEEGTIIKHDELLSNSLRWYVNKGGNK